MYVRCKPIRSVKARTAWAKKHRRCQACGRTECLETHHICNFQRSDEPPNFFRGCMWCHAAMRSRGVVKEGERLPKLTPGMVLRLKRMHDPAEYDPARLTLLNGQRLPDEEAIPAYYLNSLRAHGVVLA